jgi:hypothetical protein
VENSNSGHRRCAPNESAEKENFERKFKDPNGTPSASDNPVSFAGLRYQQTLVAWGTIGAVAAKNVAGSVPVVFFYMGRGGQNAASRVLWEATRSQIDGTEGVYGIPLQELSSAHPESL